MKTRIKKLFLLAIILLTPNLVRAESACSYEEQTELNDIVANVKASYEIIDVYVGKTYEVYNPNEDGTFPEVDSYAKEFQFTILNITDDVYVKVSNNQNSTVYTFKSTDTKDGMITFTTPDVFELTTYTFEVYANKYSCIGELFRKFTITTPVYNSFSKYSICQDNPDFYYCQEFITTENLTISDFYTKVQEYANQKEKEEQEKEEQERNKSIIERIKDFYNDNTIVIYTIGIVIVIVGVATTVILVKKKRSRVL